MANRQHRRSNVEVRFVLLLLLCLPAAASCGSEDVSSSDVNEAGADDASHDAGSGVTPDASPDASVGDTGGVDRWTEADWSQYDVPEDVQMLLTFVLENAYYLAVAECECGTGTAPEECVESVMGQFGVDESTLSCLAGGYVPGERLGRYATCLGDLLATASSCVETTCSDSCYSAATDELDCERDGEAGGAEVMRRCGFEITGLF